MPGAIRIDRAIAYRYASCSVHRAQVELLSFTLHYSKLAFVIGSTNIVLARFRLIAAARALIIDYTGLPDDTNYRYRFAVDINYRSVPRTARRLLLIPHA